MISFTDYFSAQTGTLLDDGVTQSAFASTYTSWLNNVVLPGFEDGDWVGLVGVSINQNSTDGPTLVNTSGMDAAQFEALNAEFMALFAEAEDLIVKTGKVTQTRYYADLAPVTETPYVIEADAQTGETGTDGDAGLPGDDGNDGIDGTDATVAGTDGIDGTNGADAKGTGAPSLRTVAIAGTDGTDGTAGTSGGDGTVGTAGGDGSAGGNGADGGDAIVIASPETYDYLLINSEGGTANSILGGNGGNGGDGGDGGAGGDGGSGGDGTDGGDGGNGGAGGDGDGANGFQAGADGGDAGDGAVAGDGGDGADGMDGGNGGDGGDGGIGGNAIVNGTLSRVVITGDTDLTILGGLIGTGGEGGTGGTGGTGGDAGTAGTDGTGGIAGSGGEGSGAGADGADGTAGTDATGSTDGTSGTDGADGADGTDGTGGNGVLRTAAFSDRVDVDATAFTGQLTISGSDGDDTFLAGSGGSSFYATLGNDEYTAGAGVDVFIFTDAAQSDGTTSTATIHDFDFANDVIDVHYIDTSVSLTKAGDTLLVDLDADGTTDMSIIIDGLGTYVGSLNDLLA